jgi:glycosyltransferase involved in cell wall biosynthesis
MISLAIPSYDRSDYVIESFIKVLRDERISEILIVDDHSRIQEFSKLQNLISALSSDSHYHKIKLIRNEENLGSFLNKKKCVEECKNKWVILLDSDNSIDINYINSLENKRDEKTIYTPSRAICSSEILDYRKYSNTVVNKQKYIEIVSQGGNITWDCILNTGNYYFNKETYLKSIELEPELRDPLAADAFYLIYLWMKNSECGKLEIVEGMEYLHRLHDNSHWTVYGESSTQFIRSLTQEIISWN